MPNKNLIIASVISTLLTEEPRWKREKVDVPNPLLAILNKYKGMDNVFFTMSNLNKTGIFPKSAESIGPLGIYCYPLTDKIHQQLVTNSLPFAMDRKFIHFFKAKDPSKSLLISDGPNNDWGISPEENEAIYNHLIKIDTVKIKKEKFDYENYKYHQVEEPADLTSAEKLFLENFVLYENAGYSLYVVAKSISQGKGIKFTKLLMEMGFHGVVDLGAGRIYNGEPTQAVFFSSAFITPLDSVPNYYAQYGSDSKFSPLSNYTELGGASYASGPYADAKRKSSKLESNKLKLEIAIKKLQERYGVSEEEIFTNPEYIVKIYKEMKYSNINATILVNRVPLDKIIKLLPEFGSLSEGFSEALIKKLSLDQIKNLNMEQFKFNDLSILAKKFEESSSIEDFVQFLQDKKLAINLNFQKPELLWKIFPFVTKLRFKEMIANILGGVEKYRDILIKNPDENIRAQAVANLNPEEASQMFLSDSSEIVRNALLDIVPITFAERPEITDDQAVAIIKNSALKSYDILNMLSSYVMKIDKARNHPPGFLYKILKSISTVDLIEKNIRKLTTTEIMDLAVNETETSKLEIYINALPDRLAANSLAKNKLFLKSPDYYSFFIKKTYIPILMKHPLAIARASIASVADEEQLHELAKDSDPYVRQKAISRIFNKSIIEKAANEDPDPNVRHLAKERLRWMY